MLDIFTVAVPEEKQNQNFKVMLLDSNKYAREVVTSWTEGFVDRDGDIVKKFQTTFNSSFWEFYLNACFNKLGFGIDFSYNRPDFILEKDGVRLIAEAVISSHPGDGIPEWERSFEKNVESELWFQVVYLSTIRLANAISKKYKKYKEEYCKLTHVENMPFIICVAPFEQPFFFMQADNAIRRLLYKFHAPLYIKDKKDGRISVVGAEYVDKVVKHNNSEVELGLFTDDRMKEVSAIIFSNVATMTKVKALVSEQYPTTFFFATRYQSGTWDEPYKIMARGSEYSETLLDGLHIYMNPFAQNKFDPDIFYSQEVSLHDFDPLSNSPLEYVQDGALLTHGCITLNQDPSLKGKIVKKESKTFCDYSFKWNEDTLYQIDAVVGPSKNCHIGHYCGWTVVVFQDAIDEDWGAFAKNKYVYTIQDFLSLGDDDAMLSSPGFFETRDNAYSAVKEVIDSNSRD